MVARQTQGSRRAGGRAVISFCVPAYDEERLLPRTLASIHAAARRLALDYGIVVADRHGQGDGRLRAVRLGLRRQREQFREVGCRRRRFGQVELPSAEARQAGCTKGARALCG